MWPPYAPTGYGAFGSGEIGMLSFHSPLVGEGATWWTGGKIVLSAEPAIPPNMSGNHPASSGRLEQSRTGYLGGRRRRDDAGFVVVGILRRSALFHIGSASVTTFL